MLPTLIVVFREALEATLIISLLCAATRDVPHRGRWIGAGVAAGMAGALALAAGADAISVAMDGVGQDVLNGCILLTAVLLLAWHNLWMQQHAREATQEARALAESVRAGVRTLPALAIVAGATVLREGSELGIFLYGIWIGSDHQVAPMLVGAVGGVTAALALGATLYFSLARIPLRRVFGPIQGFIVLLCGGLAAQSAAHFAAAGWLPSLGERLWNLSDILSEHSVLGQTLSTLLGYRAAPSGIEVLAYLTTLSALGAAMVLQGRRNGPGHAQRTLAPAQAR